MSSFDETHDENASAKKRESESAAANDPAGIRVPASVEFDFSCTWCSNQVIRRSGPNLLRCGAGHEWPLGAEELDYLNHLLDGGEDSLEAAIEGRAFRRDIECWLELPHGYSLRAPTWPSECSYLRVCDAEEQELIRISALRFKRNPATSLRLLLQHAGGILSHTGVYRDDEGQLISYGAEIVLYLPGCKLSIRTHSHQAPAYVRIADKNGRDVIFWDEQEIREEPVEMLGALISAALSAQLPGSDEAM